MRNVPDLPDALQRFGAFGERVGDSRLAVFLDYDGTLTPIVPRPEDARLSDDARAAVRDLASRFPVAIVSGRDRADVARLVGLDGLVYAGSHGFDISGPHGLRLEHPAGVKRLPALDDAERELRAGIAGIVGAAVERKRFAVALHYRNVPDDRVGEIEPLVARVAGDLPELRVTGGKKVHELRPDVDWDKGRAVLWLLESLGLDRPGTLPLYLGDDVTDEDAFRAVADRGAGVLVGRREGETEATWTLSDPDAVEPFLRALAARAGHR